MIKKYFFLFSFLFLFLFPIQSQCIDTSVNVYGSWTPWSYLSNADLHVKVLYWESDRVFRGCEYIKQADYYHSRVDVDINWCFRFVIDNYICPDKKEIKKHYKSDQWYEYTGWVEYYVTDAYPTIKDVLKKYEFPLISPLSPDRDSKRALRHAKAKIRIAPYKHKPTCFNILFDDIGVAISCNDWEWLWSVNVKVIK